MNQIEWAKKGKLSPEMQITIERENIDAGALIADIASGRTIILRSNKRKPARFCAVGKKLAVKVNVNIGTSPGVIDLGEEEKKIRISEQFGADAIMDLSTGGDIDWIRKHILSRTCLPVGTVPVYQAAIEAKKKRGSIAAMTEEDIFNVIQRNAEDGVDFMTVHCGVTRKAMSILSRFPRVTGVVSRGGAILCNWMKKNGKENPLFNQFERLLEIARQYDVTLSLGDGMRPGSIADASDRSQFYELKELSRLGGKALAADVQVMIEGPGHLPLNHIKKNVQWQKRLCHGAPFYVLGPLVTDIAPGYDHITGAIGGALAGAYGADLLCYVTPAEHLRLPDANDVKEGLIASRIAAHSADIARGNQTAYDRDLSISKARARRDWQKQIELAIDCEKADYYRQSGKMEDEDICTMCGDFCSLKLMEKLSRE